MSAKTPAKKKKPTTIRIGNYRGHFDGVEAAQLAYICEEHKRKPSQMVKFLVGEEYNKLKK